MQGKIWIRDWRAKLERELFNVKQASISPANKKFILDFISFSRADGISESRCVRYSEILRKVVLFMGKDLRQVAKTDVVAFLEDIENKPYSPSTRIMFRALLRRFFKWLRDTEDMPEEVAWIRYNVKDRRRRLPQEVLTESEIMAMIQATDHPRDKAFISVLYESGGRIGEIGGLRLKHIQFDDYGAQIVVDGKTGMRRIRLISSVPYLVTWLNAHPSKDPDAPLWTSLGKNRTSVLKYNSMLALLKRATRTAGVTKRVFPYAFRHARATHLANHLTEAQMKQYFGWVQGSNVASVYIHLSGKEVDDALLRIHGLKKEDGQKQRIFRPLNCARCGTRLPPTAKVCEKCWLPRSVETAIEQKEKEDKFMALQDPAIIEALIERKVKETLKQNGFVRS